MKILIWHVHGGWMDSFVHGRHEYLLPVNPQHDGWGLGRGGRPWPASVREVPVQQLAAEHIDAVVLQRPEEIEQVKTLTGRVPGVDLPAVFLEHNTPKTGDVPNSRHPLAEQSRIPIVHVTHFNQLFWDNGRAQNLVIEHGIKDPGYLYTGTRPTLGVAINEPVRRWRVTGTDLLPGFAQLAPLEVFGLGTDKLPAALELPEQQLLIHGDIAPAQLHRRLPQTRAYLHPFRWTSLGLALLEAMHLGMPVIALGATEAFRAVPPEAGAVSSSVAELERTARLLLQDQQEATRRGLAARDFALKHYSLQRFLDDWDRVLEAYVPDLSTPLSEGTAS